MKQTLCFLCLLLLSNRSGWSQPLIFGVVPQQSAIELAKKWNPILASLSSTTQLDIQFRTAKDIPTFEQHLALGDYDLAFMTPFQYVSSQTAVHYQAFVKASNPPINGVIVVNTQSDIHTLDDLQYKTMVFTSSEFSASTWIIHHELQEAGIPVYSRYVSSEQSVYLNIAKGFFTAGGGVLNTLEYTSNAVKDDLRILWTSKDYPTYAFAHNKALDEASVRLIQHALIQLAITPKGQQQLQALGLSPLIPASHDDWHSLRTTFPQQQSGAQ